MQRQCSRLWIPFVVILPRRIPSLLLVVVVHNRNNIALDLRKKRKKWVRRVLKRLNGVRELGSGRRVVESRPELGDRRPAYYGFSAEHA